MDLKEKEFNFWLPIRTFIQTNQKIKRFSLVTTDKYFDPPDLNKIGLIISNLRNSAKVIFYKDREIRIEIQKGTLFKVGPEYCLQHIRRILESSFHQWLIKQASIPRVNGGINCGKPTNKLTETDKPVSSESQFSKTKKRSREKKKREAGEEEKKRDKEELINF